MTSLGHRRQKRVIESKIDKIVTTQFLLLCPSNHFKDEDGEDISGDLPHHRGGGTTP